MPVRTEYYMGATKASPFYGEPQNPATMGNEPAQRVQTHEFPAGWLVQYWSGWEGWTPRDWQPRVQGWKIHISATPECAEQTLVRTTEICLHAGAAFKFLPTIAELTESSSKQSDRGSAGKFITIYPDNDEQLAQLLDSLSTELAGQHGPYILSDLRYTDNAPVFVRYGAILGLETPDVDDQPIDSIVDPHTMGLVPDLRTPSFTIPDGIELPETLQAAYAASQESCQSRLDDFSSIEPLHFSNAGGVYRAELPNGEVRVLREARPHAGLDGRNRCALQRQLREEEVLKDLTGLPGVQQIRSSFTAWEHRFLELDYAEGTTLTSWMVSHTDLQESDPEQYALDTVAIVDQLISSVAAIHKRGWALGDLHPGNVLVAEDGTVTVLDLEDATRLDAEREIGFRVFEYCADETLNAEQADWFAVARIIMLLYCADFEIEAVSPSFWKRCHQEIQHTYGDSAANQLSWVENHYPKTARPVLASDFTVDVPPPELKVDTAISGLLSGIDWSRQYAHHGAFPGDISETSLHSHETLTTGRAGVVLAQHRVGTSPVNSDIAALTTVARRWPAHDNPGLLNGLAGIALALSELGETDQSVVAAGKALTWSLARRRLDLAGGQAGTILVALEVAHAAEDRKLTDAALQAYERLHHTVTPNSSAWTSLCRRRGLYWGLTGLALTDLVVHSITGNHEPLRRAHEHLRADVEACVTAESGETTVLDEANNRTLPYVEWGTAGLLLVASALERVSGNTILTPDERGGMIAACSGDFYIYPGYDHGRAGLVTALSASIGDQATATSRQVDLLLNSLLIHQEHVVTIGDGLIRLSSDLGTGAAGIALALHAYRSAQPYLTLPISRRSCEYFALQPIPQPPEPDSDPFDPTVETSRTLVA